MLHNCFHFAFQSAWTLRRDEQEIKNHRLSSLFSSYCHCPGAMLLKNVSRLPLGAEASLLLPSDLFLCYLLLSCLHKNLHWTQVVERNICSQPVQPQMSVWGLILPNSLSCAFLFGCFTLLLCIQHVLQGLWVKKPSTRTNSQEAAEI